MKTKSKRKPKKSKVGPIKISTSEIHIVESDSPDGPWTNIPNKAIKIKNTTIDDLRLENSIYNWMVPVDLMTELYDSAMNINTRLSSNQLQFLREFFGNNFTLYDVRIWLNKKGFDIEKTGWPFIVELVKKEKAEQSNSELIQLESKEFNILCALADSPTRLKQDELCECDKPKLARKTVSSLLQRLKSIGFIDYNPKNKKGAAITQKGTDYLNRKSKSTNTNS